MTDIVSRFDARLNEIADNHEYKDGSWVLIYLTQKEALELRAHLDAVADG